MGSLEKERSIQGLCGICLATASYVALKGRHQVKNKREKVTLGTPSLILKLGEEEEGWAGCGAHFKGKSSS